MAGKRQIFRQRSLDKLQSPERLDELLRIVRPKTWILLATLGVGMLLVLLWSFLGQVPTAARGQGILVRPTQVVGFQSPANGQIETILIAIGDTVRAGQLLATLELPLLQKSLEEEKARLRLAQRHGREMSDLEISLAERERVVIQDQREQIARRIARVQKAADDYRQRSLDYLQEQEGNIERARELSEQLGAALDERYEGLLELQEKDEISRVELIKPQTDVFDNRLRRAELELQVVELALRRQSVDEYYDERMDVIDGLRVEEARLAVLDMTIERRLQEDKIESEREQGEIVQRIHELEVQLQTESRVVAEKPGKILEITAVTGQQVAVAQGLGKMAVELPGKELQAIAYFSIKDGKKIRPGQPIRISPSTVERERWGGIVGQVEQVSAFPVTTDAAAYQIGDREIAAILLGGEPRIQVIATLDLAPGGPVEAEALVGGGASLGQRYRWTSGAGPEVAITAGTTGELRVTVEMRAPIVLVLPWLRSVLGVGAS